MNTYHMNAVLLFLLNNNKKFKYLVLIMQLMDKAIFFNQLFNLVWPIRIIHVWVKAWIKQYQRLIGALWD